MLHFFLFMKTQEYTCQHFSSFKADRPTGYRKFLRISNIKELWAMTRIPSRHSFLERKGGPSASADGGQLIAICHSKGKHTDELKVEKRKKAKASPNGNHAAHFPFWRERGNDDKVLSSLAVSLQNYEIFDFNNIDSPVFAGRWWKVESSMLGNRRAC